MIISPLGVRRDLGTGSEKLTTPRMPRSAARLRAAAMKKLSPLAATSSVSARREISALS
uniref:hypothetical protein n=1 Tax=Streptomyces kaniharaensis TaxID=212423 RepID=UPI0012972962|nr:hypothetical protein [Streptomyces kaniharaensis]